MRGGGRPGFLRARSLVLLAVGGVVVALAVPPVMDRVLPGCQNGVPLTVAADPAVAPVAEVAAQRLAEQDRRVEGHCVDVDVQALEPARVASSLRKDGEGGEGQPRPDVWIPDSSVWVERTRQSSAGAQRLVPENASVARSPLVVAMPEPAARSLGWPDASVGWQDLLSAVQGDGGSDLRVGLADPHTSSAALAALTSLQEAAGVAGEDANPLESAALLVRLRRSLSAVAPDPEALLARSVSAFPALEHSVWRVNSENPGTKLVGVYPEEGAPAADFPYAVLRAPWGDADTSAAAELLRDAFTSAPVREALSENGLRAPDGKAGSFASAEAGLSRERPQQRPLPSVEALQGTLRSWEVAGRTGHILAVIDVSGSMGEQVPSAGGVTRIELARSAAKESLQLFGDSTEIGVWRFADRVDGDRDHEELVATGPLAQRVGDGSRAEAVKRAFEGLEAIPGGGTGLYDTAAAAYETASKGYSPDLLNVVVLLTDGRNDDPDSISRAELVQQVRERYDEKKPVQFITIAYGRDAETGVLKQLAKVTGGSFYQSKDPADIRKVFLDAISDS